MNILNDIFGASIVRTIGLSLIGIITVLNIGLAWWSYRDIVSRSRNIFWHIVVIVGVLLSGVFGFVLYVLLRPLQTLADAEIERMELTLLQSELAAVKAPKPAPAPMPKKEKKNV